MEVLGLLGILALWGALGAGSWILALVATRGRAPLLGLLLAFAAGISGGFLVALVSETALGFWISLAMAVAAGTIASYITIRLARRSGSLDPDASIARV